MIVLFATEQQFQDLNGFTHGVSQLEFSKDGQDRWIVGKEVIDNPDFEAIKPQLLALAEGEYVPVPEPNDNA